MPSRELVYGCGTDDSMSSGLAINAVDTMELCQIVMTNKIVKAGTNDSVANSRVSEQLDGTRVVN